MKKILLTLVAAVVLMSSFCGCKHNPPMKQEIAASVQADIYLTDKMTGYTTRTFHDKLAALYDAGEREVSILIFSPGGVVYDCFGAVDVMQEFQKMGMHITTYAYGLCASAAVPVFLSGDERISGKNTVFMLHEPDRSMVTDEDVLELMNLNRELYMNIVVQHSWLNRLEVEKIIVDYTWFDAKQAKIWGMVDKII